MLYTGLAFPLILISPDSNSSTVTVGLSNDTVLIKSNLLLLLETVVGNRPFNRLYGSVVTELLGEPNDDVLLALARYYTVDAIKKWEPKVNLKGLNYFRYQEKLRLILQYYIKGSGELQTLQIEINN